MGCRNLQEQVTIAELRPHLYQVTLSGTQQTLTIEAIQVLTTRKYKEMGSPWAEKHGVYMCLIFEMSIWELITNAKKN